jgi:uncharacterized protein
MQILPHFMKFKPITLADKPLFDEYFAEFPPRISELTFTNLFVWRHSRKYEFAEIDSHLIILYDNKFLQPIGKNPESIIPGLLKEHSSIERVDETIALKTTGCKVEEDRNNWDYVYSIEDLRTLAGNKYAPKRNFIKQCEKCEPDVCALDKDTVHGFLQLQKDWCSLRKCDDDANLQAENTAVMEALKNFEMLNLFGICIYVNKRIEGFAIGEKLNNDTYVEHFEKANTNINGLYQYILYNFAKSIRGEFSYLNREQDLGIEGLRKAKESYYPVRMIKKYRITSA